MDVLSTTVSEGASMTIRESDLRSEDGKFLENAVSTSSRSRFEVLMVLGFPPSSRRFKTSGLAAAWIEGGSTHRSVVAAPFVIKVNVR